MPAKDKILVADVRYFPYSPPKLWSQPHFQYDEPKLNLLWLACPEIDLLHDKQWDGNEISRDIDAHLCGKVRKMLQGPPVEFMRDFVRLDGGVPDITIGWPPTWRQTMWGRAKEANARLCAELGPNVYVVNFRR